MAKLENKGGGRSYWELDEEPTPPAGQYVCVCVDVHDEFGVERKKFQSEEMEKLDICQFLFGSRLADNTPFKFTSRQMRISGNEKSSLMVMLTSWLGEKPAMGWDYATPFADGGCLGRKAIITLGMQKSADGSREYLTILSITGCPEDQAVGPFGATKPTAKAKPAAAAKATPAKPAGDPVPF